MATKTVKKPAQTKIKPAAASPASTAKKAPASKPATAAPAKSSATSSTKAAPQPADKTASKPAAKKPAATTSTAAKNQAKPTVPPKPVSKPTTETVVKPAPVKKQKWDEIRILLMQMKDATLREISRSIKSGSEATVGEETTGDIYDQASSERDRELELILSDRERQKLHNIDDALLRMDDGEYGICEECDEEIPLGRLKAMPFTRHCVKCKSDLERLQAQTRRFEEDRAYREIPLGDEDEG